MFWGHVQGCGAGQRAAGRRRFVLVRLLAGLAGGSLVLAGVAGCDGAEADPDPGPVEPPVVGSTTEDGANAGDDDSGVDEDDGASGPQEYEHPVPGPDFDDDGQAGAEAAAVYFLELYSYVYATGDFEKWSATTATDCGFCSATVEHVSEIYSEDGYATKAPPQIQEILSQMDNSQEGAYVVEMRFRDGELRVFSSQGEVVRTAPGGDVAAWFLVQRVSDGWRLLGVESEAAEGS